MFIKNWRVMKVSISMQLDVAQVKIARPFAKLSTHNKVQILNFSKAIVIPK